MVENAAAYDPFAEENAASGGGLWDGKTVTILGVQTAVSLLTKREGDQLVPYIDSRTGQQVSRNELIIVGLAEDEDKERKESYSAGSLRPTEDGLGFESADPTKPTQVHKNSELFKFGAYLKAGGFDTSQFYSGGKLNFSALKGARIIFKGEDVLDKNGKPKKNAKGYTNQKFWPRQYVGQAAGVSAGPKGNGYTAEFDVTVVEVLTKNGGSLKQHELVRNLSMDAAQYILRAASGTGWSKQGSTYQLAA